MPYLTYYGRLARQSAYSIVKGAALPFVRREAIRSGAHAMPFPGATYAPWQVDPEFRSIYRAIKRNTMVDMWRCYELWTLVGELRDVPGDIIEVGVWRGGTGTLLATGATRHRLDATVHLCDTWQGVVKTGGIDAYYRDGQHDDAARETVAQLIERLGLRNVELHEGVFPDETAERIADRTFRLCHCDVDVYQSASDVLGWVWPRLSSGGIVVFDDYGFSTCPGVTRLVDEQRGLPDRLVLYNLNGHGLVVKR